MFRLLFLFIPFVLFGQSKRNEYDVYKKFLERKIHYQVRSEFANFDFGKYKSEEPLEDQEIISKFFAYGFTGEVAYMIGDSTDLGLGFSYYKLFDHDLSYHPVFARIRFFTEEGINSFYISVKTGYNIGNYKGIHLEGGFGYRFGLFNLTPVNLNLFVTLNDLDYPTYENNFKGGFAFGIEL